MGAVGEFVGSIAVVITLIYLAIQMKLNTRSIEENRKALISQTFQARAHELQTIQLTAAASQSLCNILDKVAETGMPMAADLDKLDELTSAEFVRYKQFVGANRTRIDNIVFQYHQGLIDDEQYQVIRRAIFKMSPTWQALGLTFGRPSFLAEIEDVKRDTENA